LEIVGSIWSISSEPVRRISPWLKSKVRDVTPLAKVTLFEPRNGAAKLLAPVIGVQMPSRLWALKARSGTSSRKLDPAHAELELGETSL
jgi:hypothetical protein